jgi:hypothetical protein
VVVVPALRQQLGIEIEEVGFGGGFGFGLN